MSASHRNVSSQEPCPICQAADWCWISAEGDVVGCRREPGASNQHTDRCGVPFWIYSQDAKGTWVPGLARGRIHTQPEEAVLDDAEPAGARRTYSHDRAAPEDLDAAYRTLMAALKLDVGHEQALMGDRGFVRSELERAGYRSRIGPISEDAIQAVRHSIAARLYPDWKARLDEQQGLHEALADGAVFQPNWESIFGPGWDAAVDWELYRIPGLWRDAGDRTRFASVDGMLIFVHDIADRIIATQLRTADGTYLPPCSPRDLKGGVSGAPSGQHAHVPTFCSRTARLAIVTEGVLKADRIAAELRRHSIDVLVIGVPHVGAWRMALPILEHAKVAGVLVAYDADARRKAMVCAGLTNLACAIAERGLGVGLVTWPEASGKGLDDVFQGGHLATVRCLTGAEPWARLGELRQQCRLPLSDGVDARGVLAGLVDRVREDRTNAYDPAVIAALCALPEVSVEYQRLVEALSAKRALGKKDTGRLLREVAKARKGGTKGDHGSSGNGPAGAPPFQTILTSFDYGEDKLVSAVAEAHKALARAGAYTNGSFVVRVATTSQEQQAASAWTRSDGTTCYALHAGAPQIVTLTPATLRLAIAEQLQFTRTGKAGVFPILPPAEVVNAIHDLQAGWPLPQLMGISEIPVLRRDGTIAQRPGYDPASGYWIDGALSVPPISDKPSESERREAYELLREPFVNFPWAQPGSECVSIAEILQILARPYIDGAVPGYVHDASAGGTGKTLQTDCVSLITQGRYASRKAYPGRSDDGDDEINKFLGGYAVRGCPYIVLDDIKRPLGGQTLDMVLTAGDTCDFRILGKSKTVTLPWRATMSFTGVNISYYGQMSRRVLVARVESPLERPQDRADFKHAPLLPWIAASRAKLVAAGLTVLRAYVVAGCPDQKTGVWGSFEAWSALIPGAIKFAGGPNVLDYRVPEEALDRDRETDIELAAGLEAYLAHIEESACSAVQIARDLSAADLNAKLQPFRSALAASTRSKLPDARAIGNVLRAHRGRAINMGEGRVVKLVYTGSPNKRDPALWSIAELRPATETAEEKTKRERAERERAEHQRAEREKDEAWEQDRRRLEEMI